MYLINLAAHYYSPLLHLLIVAAVCLASINVFAQTPPNVCATGQVVTSTLANIGQGCAQVSYPNVSGTPTNVSSFTNDAGYTTNSALSAYATILTVNGKFTIPIGTSGQYLNGLGTPVNFPAIAANQAYENTTQRLNPILINKSVAVAGGAGNAVFNLTNDGTSTGTSLCPNGVMLNSPNLSVNDATAPYQFSWAWSNSNKTMTVLAQKASGLAVLTFTLLGIPAPVANGTSVNATTICY